MSIESTQFIKRQDALHSLKRRGFTVFDDDCNDRIAFMLYENRESIFENYEVINDDITICTKCHHPTYTTNEQICGTCKEMIDNNFIRP